LSFLDYLARLVRWILEFFVDVDENVAEVVVSLTDAEVVVVAAAAVGIVVVVVVVVAGDHCDLGFVSCFQL
jgi:hypothetical protein